MDLKGEIVRLVSVQQPPFIILNEKSGKIESGFLVDLLNILQQCLNFTYTLYRTEEFGSYNGTHFTGAVGELYRDKADIGLVSIFMNKYRVQAVDFSPSLFLESVRLITQRPSDVLLSTNPYISTFTDSAWIAVISLWMILEVSIFIAFLFHDREIILHLNNSRVSRLSNSNTIKKYLKKLLNILMEDKSNLSYCSGKIVNFTLYFMFYFMTFTYFSSSFTSSRTVKKILLPFTTFEDLLRLKDFDVGSMKISFIPDALKSSKIPSYQAMWEKIKKKETNFVKSIEEGIQKVRTTRKFVFVSPQSHALKVINKDCFFAMSPKKYFTAGHYILYRKTFRYKSYFNKIIRKLLENGVINRLLKMYLPEELICNSIETQSVGIPFVKPLFVLLGTGMLASLMASQIEIILYRIWLKNE